MINRLTLQTTLSLIFALSILAHAGELKPGNSKAFSKGLTIVSTDAGVYSVGTRSMRIYNDDLAQSVYKKYRANQRVVMSEDGGHFAILKYNDHSPTTFSLLQIDMYDAAGKFLWSHRKPQGSSVVVANGSSAAMSIVGAEGAPQSMLELYSSTGDVVATVPVSRLYGVRYSDSGDRLFVNSADSGLHVFSATGEHLSTLGFADWFGFSHDCSQILTATENSITLYREGVRIKNVTYDFSSTGGVVALKIDPAQQVAVVAFRKAIRVYRIPSFELVAEHLPADGCGYTGMDLSSAGHIAVGFDTPETEDGRKVHRAGGVELYDLTLNRLAEYPLNYSDWARDYPMVGFLHDGANLRVVTRNAASVCTISD